MRFSNGPFNEDVIDWAVPVARWLNRLVDRRWPLVWKSTLRQEQRDHESTRAHLATTRRYFQDAVACVRRLEAEAEAAFEKTAPSFFVDIKIDALMESSFVRIDARVSRGGAVVDRGVFERVRKDPENALLLFRNISRRLVDTMADKMVETITGVSPAELREAEKKRDQRDIAWLHAGAWVR